VDARKQRCVPARVTGMKNDLAAPPCESRREPLEDYLSNREFVSSSQLRRFEKSGLTAGQLPDGGVVSGTVMGEAFHALVLEPQMFPERYLVPADTAAAQRVDSGEEAIRRQSLDAWQWSALCRGRDALLESRQAPVSDWLSAGRKELSIYWTDTQGGRWKARPDCFTDHIVLDLKTTNDCGGESFRRTRERFGYDLQAAHYVDAVARLTGEAPRFAFLAVELSTPYAVRVHELGELELDAARRRLEVLKNAYVAASVSTGRDSPRGA